jgi:hypothetical protein
MLAYVPVRRAFAADVSFIANQIPSPARSAVSRRRLGFCHAKVTQRHLASSAF